MTWNEIKLRIFFIYKESTYLRRNIIRYTWCSFYVEDIICTAVTEINNCFLPPKWHHIPQMMIRQYRVRKTFPGNFVELRLYSVKSKSVVTTSCGNKFYSVNDLSSFLAEIIPSVALEPEYLPSLTLSSSPLILMFFPLTKLGARLAKQYRLSVVSIFFYTL